MKRVIPRAAGTGSCSMCGSKRATIKWDAAARVWYCALRADAPQPKRRPSAPRAEPPAPPEPALPPLRCDRCGAVLLDGAADGVSAHCAKCRRWVVQGGAV
jgi:hypothetical protein